MSNNKREGFSPVDGMMITLIKMGGGIGPGIDIGVDGCILLCTA